MPRNVLQTLTIVALVAAIFFVAHNFVRYVLRVDGGYSQWTVFTGCTKTCGTGTRFRSRTCNNPEPRFGGFNCSILGEDTQTFKCNMFPCPVDGGYGEWSNFGECSVTCGEGVQQRERRCDNPQPMYGGQNCEQLELGPNIETKACKMESCPVNGGFGSWGEFSDCTVTCGGGVKQKERRCDSPEPAFGGQTCEEQGLGASVETQLCNKAPCPTDGGYTDWTEFSECTVSCGGGTQERSRECTKPKPAHGGKDCEGLGPAIESQACNTKTCPPQTAQDEGKEQKKSSEGNEDQKEKGDGNEGKKEEKKQENK